MQRQDFDTVCACAGHMVRVLSKVCVNGMLVEINQTLDRKHVLSNVSHLPSLQIQVLGYPPGGLLWRGGGFRDVHRAFFEKNLHSKIRVSDVPLTDSALRLRLCLYMRSKN